MTVIYAIETSVGSAGLAVRDALGFRFYASDQLFNTLENQQYARLTEIYSAINRLTAAPAKARERQARSKTFVNPLGEVSHGCQTW